MGAVLWKGLVFSLSLFLTCFFGTLVFLAPLLPLALRSPALGRRLMDYFLWLWFVLAAALYELFLGVKVIIHGSPASAKDSVLLICNHRTRLDWLFLISYQLRCGTLSNYRISLKAALQSIPGPGWAMQCAGFLFLQRDWKKDQDWISRSLKYFAETGTQPQFLLFPEGTDLCENGLRKSRLFAETNDLPMYQYVLHPRTTGFIHFVNKMREHKILDSVLDMTVAYPEDIVHSEAQLGKGVAPQAVHFYAHNHLASELPATPEKLEAWCRSIWQEKEVLLKRFYEEKTFATNGKVSAVSKEKESSIRLLMQSVIAFWAVFVMMVFWALIFVPMFKWYCILSTLTFVFIGRSYGGVDALLYFSCD